MNFYVNLFTYVDVKVYRNFAENDVNCKHCCEFYVKLQEFSENHGKLLREFLREFYVNVNFSGYVTVKT